MASGRQIARQLAHVPEYVGVFGFAAFAPVHLASAMHGMMQISPTVAALEEFAEVLQASDRAKSSNLEDVLHSYYVHQQAIAEGAGKRLTKEEQHLHRIAANDLYLPYSPSILLPVDMRTYSSHLRSSSHPRSLIAKCTNGRQEDLTAC